jgi:hypothetical protein
MRKKILVLALAGLSAVTAFTGCETTESGAAPSANYGASFNDPWYQGGVYTRDDVVVTPPTQPRPTHPIARPGAPSIPTTPRGGR